jgi:hypothetical protein
MKNALSRGLPCQIFCRKVYRIQDTCTLEEGVSSYAGWEIFSPRMLSGSRRRHSRVAWEHFDRC